MKHEVILVGGPADGKLVMVEHDQLHYVHVTPLRAKWVPDGLPSERAVSPDRTVYAPRRRGDYSWYQEGTR